MDEIFEIFQGALNARGSNDDDFCDRLSSRYTVVILVVFAVFVMGNYYGGEPMTCWAPVHFEGSHTTFATKYCWIKNTYYLPWDENIPSDWGTTKGRQMINYYQWIPFILIGQAILFYLPSVVWHGFNSRAGVDADNLLRSAHTFAKTEMVETRDRTLKMVASQMDRFLVNRDDGERFHFDLKSIVAGTCCRPCGKRFGNYLVLLYILSKVCYIGNVIGQLFLLNVVLSTKYNTFGFDVVKQKIQNTTTYFEDGYVAFPRVTLCEFEIRGQDMSNVHSYTLQCVLPVNLFNESIYLFLWYWMVFIACASSVNFLVWLLRFVIKADRTRFVANHLKLGNVRYTPEQLGEFMDGYLRQDGCLLLRLIAHNSDNITTTEITCSMFYHHFEKDHHEVENVDINSLTSNPSLKQNYF